MKAVVYKHELTVEPGVQEIFMSSAAKVLCVQGHHDKPVLYAITTTHDMGRRRFLKVPTGQEHEDLLLAAYIGTVMLERGFVLHIFELP